MAESMGGFTAPIGCDRIKVELLVMLNAMIPVPGETFTAWWSNTGSGPARAEYHAGIGMGPGDADDEVVIYYHDLPDEIRDEAMTRAWQDQSMTPLDELLAIAGVAGRPDACAGWPARSDVPARVPKTDRSPAIGSGGRRDRRRSHGGDEQPGRTGRPPGGVPHLRPRSTTCRLMKCRSIRS